MGEDVEAQEFTRADRTRYREKVHRCLDVFERMLTEERFHTDDPMTGLEVELNLVDEVQLHFEAGHGVVGVEPLFSEHPLEHVEAPVDLLAVARPVGPGELLSLDVLPHAVSLGAAQTAGKRR